MGQVWLGISSGSYRQFDIVEVESRKSTLLNDRPRRPHFPQRLSLYVNSRESMKLRMNYSHISVVKLVNPPVGTRARLNLRRGQLSYSKFSAVCVPFGSRAASPTGTCIAGGTVR